MESTVDILTPLQITVAVVDSGNWNTLRVRGWLREMGVGVSYYLDGTDLTIN